MDADQENKVTAKGGCLCGEVAYEIRGPLRDVINCHCSKCRRFHGHVAAYTSVKREDFILKKEGCLRWYRSVKDETPDVYRGFCKECGSSLFWDPRGQENVAVAAGAKSASCQRDCVIIPLLALSRR